MDKKITYKTGDFGKPGAWIIEGDICFSFISKDMPSILIYDKDTKALIEEIPLDEGYRRGQVYSCRVKGLDYKKILYCFKAGGKEYPDPYGREIFTLTQNGAEKIYCGIFVDGDKDFKELPKDEDLFIYKAHLRGLTMDKNMANSGNYKGLISQVPRIKKLGVNALELMPIYEFKDISRDKKRNYWGYGDLNPFYMAPKATYFGENPSLGIIAMVKALHEAEIRLISEFCIEEGTDSNLVVNAIRNWAFNYGLDGFRFIGKGVPTKELLSDPYLTDKYLIFEYVPQELTPLIKGKVFIENDGFLYSVRKLLNQTGGNLSEFVNAFLKQQDLVSNINYGAAANGFTLLDSFSYYDKHNEKNGEDNFDGNNYNCSNNCGVEGPTRDKNVNLKRLSKIRSTLLSVILSQGTPLIVAGDEMLNSQEGNNNPYCQDNKTGWVNYTRKRDAALLSEYVEKLTAFKKKHLVLSEKKVFKMNDYLHLGLPDVSYHGKEPWSIGINEHDKSIGILFNGLYSDSKEDVMLLFNFNSEESIMALPKINKKKWYLITNTGSFDFDEEGKCLDKADKIKVNGGTISVLVAK